jgi:serine protease inhibitor
LSGAAGETQQQLESALGITKDDAAASVRDLVEYARSTENMQLATGLWTHRDVSVRAEFAAGLTPMTVDLLPETRLVLDRWVSDNTGGMLNQFPLEITPDTLMLLASALAVDAEWATPFSDHSGAGLSRRDSDIDSAALLHDEALTVSRVTCATVADFDVHLLAGAEGDSPGSVLGLGIAAISGDGEVVVGSELRLGDAGGCLRVEQVERAHSDAIARRQLEISLAPFEISSSHDLINNHELFGLTAALDNSHGHFPGISGTPLAVNAAAQSSIAQFSSEGFRAAAVTAVGMELGHAPETRKIEVVSVDFNRPFGFLVVDRSSGLISFAGWVARIPIMWTYDDDFVATPTKYWSPTVTHPKT